MEDYQQFEELPEDFDNFQVSDEENGDGNNVPNKRKRGTLWAEYETADLLTVIAEKEIIQKMDTKKYTHQQLFESVATALNDLFGYNRTATQVKDKYKQLKKNYMAVQKELNKSGAGTKAKDDCQFYDVMHKLFNNRPVLTQKGIDSLSFTNKRSPTCGDEREQKRRRVTMPFADLDAPGGPEPRKESKDNDKPGTEKSDYPRRSSETGKKQLNDFGQQMARDQRALMDQQMTQQKLLDDRIMDRYENISKQTVNTLLAGLREIGSASTQSPAPMPFSPWYPSYQQPFAQPSGPSARPPNFKRAQYKDHVPTSRKNFRSQSFDNTPYDESSEDERQDE